MSKKDRGTLLALVVATWLSRIPFRAKVPYGLDSIQFVLAVDQFDVRLHQPHPPGYFLFVAPGWLLNRLFHDANQAFILLSLVFSGLVVGLVFLLGCKIFDRQSGLYSAILMASSPLVWHHGEVALSNMTDCLMVCLFAVICWEIVHGRGDLVPLSGLVLGLAGGVRQNSLVFLLPLWLFAASKANRKQAVVGGLCLGLSIISWYWPMAYLSGGLAAYQSALREHWLNSNWHGFTLAWFPFNAVVVGYFVLLGTGLGALPLVFGALFYAEKFHGNKCWQTLRFRFFAVWILPSVLFFLMIYSHPTQTGHSLIYLPALFLMLPAALKRIAPKFTVVYVIILAASNVCIYLFMDSAVSRSHLKKYELSVAEMASTIRSNCSPSDTILVNLDFMFLGFRDFMFHLPEYRSFQPRLYRMSGQDRMFAGQHRKTFLFDQLTVPPQVKYFVLNADELLKNPDLAPRFSLSEYSADRVLTTASGLRLFRGEIRELSRVFPEVPVVFQ